MLMSICRLGFNKCILLVKTNMLARSAGKFPIWDTHIRSNRGAVTRYVWRIWQPKTARYALRVANVHVGTVCSSLESHFGFRTLRDALLIAVVLVQQCNL
jgi:hypothetical protein